MTEIVAVQNMFNVGGGSGHLAKLSHAEVEEPEKVLEICEARGIAYLPFFPLAVGGLGKAHPALAASAERHGATPAQIAIAWLLARSPVMLPIPGTSSPEHLEENWEARKIALSSEEVAEISEKARS
jgi:aryl-alcohol dehydrogenase-like predicted oxidoreductase